MQNRRANRRLDRLHLARVLRSAVSFDAYYYIPPLDLLTDLLRYRSTSAIVIAAAFLPSTLVAVLLTFYLLYPKFDYPRPRLDPHPKDVHARRHAQLLAGLEEMRRAGVGRARSTIRRW